MSPKHEANDIPTVSPLAENPDLSDDAFDRTLCEDPEIKVLKAELEEAKRKIRELNNTITAQRQRNNDIRGVRTPRGGAENTVEGTARGKGTPTGIRPGLQYQVIFKVMDQELLRIRSENDRLREASGAMRNNNNNNNRRPQRHCEGRGASWPMTP